LEDRIALSPGDLDPTFSGDGKQTIKIGDGGLSVDLDAASGVAVQPDGKIVLAGTEFLLGAKLFGVVRLNTDGAPDLSFSGDGNAEVDVGVDEVARSMTLQPDGKIIVVGYVNSGDAFVILRLNANGTRDSDFGTNGMGVVEVDFDVGGGNKIDEASSVVVQPDGKIVVVGYADVGAGNFDFAAVRLTPDGDLDPSFGPGGKRLSAFDLGGNKSDLATSVALQADGKIVLAGNAQGPNGDSDFAVARLNTNGTLDASFGTGGKYTLALDQSGSSKQDTVADVEIRANGAIVLGGRAAGNSVPFTVIAQINPNGSRNLLFSPGSEGATGLAIQPDGKIVVTFSKKNVGTQDLDMFVLRVTPSMDGDSSFNNTGFQKVAFNAGGSNDDFAQAVALQPDGKIVVAGSAATGAISSQFAVARLEGASTHFLAAGGAPNRVEVRSRAGTMLGTFAPFSGYNDTVALAFGDFNSDGIDDLVTSATIGNPAVKIYSGAKLSDKSFFNNPESHLLADGFPYAINFNVGANIAAGDVNGDGFADLITGAVPGNPHVKVFDGFRLKETKQIPTGDDASLLAQGFAYGLNFNVGANVAAGDVNGDGFADIITGASAGNPHTRVFDALGVLASKTLPTGNNDTVLAEFFPYGLNFNVGSFVAVADYNRDGFGDIVTGASVGNPEVRVFSGKHITNGTSDLSTSLLDFFFAFEQGQNIGVSVGASDFTGDGKADVVVGTRSGTPRLRVFKNNSPNPATSVFELDTALTGFTGSVYVSA
jgi:uncharacterized delta-60 repeat protein